VTISVHKMQGQTSQQ